MYQSLSKCAAAIENILAGSGLTQAGSCLFTALESVMFFTRFPRQERSSAALPPEAPPPPPSFTFHRPPKNTFRLIVRRSLFQTRRRP